MTVNKKLGKGLSSLLGNKEIIQNKTSDDKDLLLIPIEKIFRDESQPRKEFDKEKIEELAQKKKKNGLIQPLIVTKKDLDSYQIVAGERRWRAAQITQLKLLPALLLPKDLDKDEISLIENIQREDLKVSEEANAYQRLIEKNKYTHETLSKIVGKSRSHITNLLRILELDKFFLDLLNDGRISMGHARALIGVPDAINKAKEIIEKKLSVRQIEKITSEFKKNKTKKISKDPNITDLEKELSDKIGLKTSIQFNENGSSGSLTLYYSDLNQLDDLMKRLKK